MANVQVTGDFDSMVDDKTQPQQLQLTGVSGAKRKAEDESELENPGAKRSRAISPDHDETTINTDLTAAAKVFGIVELMERILEFSQTRDIVRCERVSRFFKDVIEGTKSKILKQKLFQEPLPQEDHHPLVHRASDASGISAESAYTSFRPRNLNRSWLVNDFKTVNGMFGSLEDPECLVVTFNPALPILSVLDMDRHTGGFQLDVKRFLETTAGDNKWIQTLISQPPLRCGCLYADRIVSDLGLEGDSRYQPLCAELNGDGIEIGTTLETFRAALVQMRDEFEDDLNLNNVNFSFGHN